MINAIIFSNNNPIKLNLLLNSIRKNAKDVFELKVLYNFNELEFEEGYKKIIETNKEIKWIKQDFNFKENIISLMESTKNEYTCFFTDNDIIYKKVTEKDLILNLKEDKNSFCFSMRLGLNTIKCNSMNTNNVIKPHHIDEDFICWNWQLHYLDFGYPLSLNGHIFRTKEISKLSKKVQFNNPDEYESSLQIFDNFPKNNMWAFKESVLVTSTNSLEDKQLNQNFILGQEIYFEKIDFSNIESCSQELNNHLTDL